MKQFIYILFLSALMCSCAGGDDLTSSSGQELCAVNFASLGMQVSATRSYLPMNSTLDIAAFKVVSDIVSDNNSALKSYTISNSTGTIAATDGKTMYLNSSHYRFYAWSPTKTLTNKNLSIYKDDDIKVTQQDDFFHGEATKTITFPAMTRLCSYVDFNVSVSPRSTNITKFSMGAQGIKLKDMTHSPVSYTLGQSAIDLTGVPLNDSCSIVTFSNSGDVSSTGGGNLLPKVDANFLLKIVINANLTTPLLLAANVPHIAFAPGYYYRFSILIESNSTLYMALQVVPWTTVMTNSTGGTAASADVLDPVNWDAVITNGYDMGVSGGGAVLIGSWTLNSADTQVGTTTTSGFVTPPWVVSPNWETALGTSTGGGITIGDWDYKTITTAGGTTGGSLTTQDWNAPVTTTTEMGNN